MQYRVLGKSGIEISVVGFGAWAIGGWAWGGADEGQAVAAIQAAIDQGINLIDTAPMYGYGRSEEIVGRAIHDRRDRVVLATKCGLVWDREEGELFFLADDKGITAAESARKIYKLLRPDSIRRELENSLRRLKTDHVDLYQTHWQESTTPIQDTVAELEKLKQQGKIRAIGVSNASRAQIEAYGPIDSDQEKFSMLDRAIESDGGLDYCRRNTISMLAYSPLSSGLLTGKIVSTRRFGEGDFRRDNPRFHPEYIARVNAMLESFRPIAEKHQATLGQLVIAWTFSQPGLTCVLCGARDAAQVGENAGAGDIRLSAAELATMDKAARGLLAATPESV
jgi:aryl-alcohol dehydrogenase-like predicted oxidoreductase